MPYTPNVPQANEQIADTQVPILQNFEYIQTTMQVEHQWNGGPNVTPTPDGTHLQVSMPAQASPSVLPAGISGIFYTTLSATPPAGYPRFFDGTTRWHFSRGKSTAMLTYSGVVTVPFPLTAPLILMEVPKFSAGSIYVWVNANTYTVGKWVSGNSTVTYLQLFQSSPPPITNVIVITGTGLSLQVATLTSPTPDTNWVINVNDPI